MRSLGRVRNSARAANKIYMLGNRAITCSTVMPVDFYGRRLTPDDESDPLHVACSFEILLED
ncbi:unnamed protein product, partial [Ectocarpus sp. 4 AP-2014]